MEVKPRTGLFWEEKMQKRRAVIAIVVCLYTLQSDMTDLLPAAPHLPLRNNKSPHIHLSLQMTLLQKENTFIFTVESSVKASQL